MGSDRARSVLMLAAHPPGRGSGSGLRGQVTLSALRECAGRVDLIAFATPDEAPFADPAARLILRPPDPSRPRRIAALRYGSSYYTAEREARLAERVRGLVARGELLPRYDVVWACQSLMARPALDGTKASIRVLDIDNIAGAERRRTAMDPSASAVKREFRVLSAIVLARAERSWCNRFAHVTVPSVLERERLGPVDVPVSVVPNTVEEGRRVSPDDAPPRLLFVGSLDYGPNVDAVEWLLEDILPRIRKACTAVELVVAGRCPTPSLISACHRGGVDLRPNVRDLDPLYATARAIVAPLRFGGGTRFKIVEAMSRGAAIVTTRVGAEGIALINGRNAFVGQDASEFADWCVQLLRNPAEATRLGDAAYATWVEHHRPEIARRAIISLIGRLAPAT